jgi:imidazolonepropionase
MTKADLIIHNASQIITVQGHGQPKAGASMSDLGMICNGAIAIMDRKIVWVGPEKDITQIDPLPGCKYWDAHQCAVLPGFVDCHTHLIFAGTREDEFSQKIAGVSYMEIAMGGGGIKRSVRTTREATIEQLISLGKSRLKTFLHFGVTCVEIKSGYGLDTVTELKILKAARFLADEFPMELPRTFLGAHEFPMEKTRQEYLEEVCEEMIPMVAEQNLAEFCDVFCEKGAYTVEDARRVLSVGKKYGLKPKIHSDQMSCLGGTELAAELKAVSADHLDYINHSGMLALKESGTIGVILPGAVFFLGLKQYPPVREMIHSGMALALSTDFNPGSCMSQHLPLMMSIACIQTRMTIPETITACTLNAAYAAGRGTVCGSIEPGKRADIIILDTPNFEMIPYHLGHNHVRDVICAGKPVIENFQEKPFQLEKN